MPPALGILLLQVTFLFLLLLPLVLFAYWLPSSSCLDILQSPLAYSFLVQISFRLPSSLHLLLFLSYSPVNPGEPFLPATYPVLPPILILPATYPVLPPSQVLFFPSRISFSLLPRYSLSCSLISSPYIFFKNSFIVPVFLFCAIPFI
jgi:hypothetical protein